MAKPTKKKNDGKYIKITTPTRFGSHKSMVIKDLGDTVICKDDIGEYVTSKSRLDNGLADSNRWDRKENIKALLMLSETDNE